MKGHSTHLFIFHSFTRSKKKRAQQKRPLRYAELTAFFSAFTPRPPTPDPHPFMDRTNALGVPLMCPVFCWGFSTCPLRVLGLPFSEALCAPGALCVHSFRWNHMGSLVLVAPSWLEALATDWSTKVFRTPLAYFRRNDKPAPRGRGPGSGKEPRPPSIAISSFYRRGDQDSEKWAQCPKLTQWPS